MSIFVRFEDSERVSETFGPYPFVQLTYNILRVGPDGDDLAYAFEGKLWCPVDARGHRLNNVSYSDVIIYDR